VDDLKYHRALAASGLPRACCAYRPDGVDGGQTRNVQQMVRNSPRRPTWISETVDSSMPARGTNIFMSTVCRLSDHGMNQCYADFCSPGCAGIFAKARRAAVSVEEHRTSQRS